MNRHWWIKLTIVVLCCMMTWSGPSAVVWASDSETDSSVQSEKRTRSYFEQFVIYVKMKWQALGQQLNPSSGHGEIGVSQGDEDEKELLWLPQPGPESTLLANHKTRFAWLGGNKSGEFTIEEEDSGKIIYREEIKDQKELFIVPSKVGMQQGRKYLWGLNGDSKLRPRRVRLLDAELDKVVQKGLKELQTMKDEDVQKELQVEITKFLETMKIKSGKGNIHRQVLQAMALFAWSDQSNGVADMYWLGYELLMQPTVKELKDEASIKLRGVLLKECRKHFDQCLP